jgi:hypothetical protein
MGIAKHFYFIQPCPTLFSERDFFYRHSTAPSRMADATSEASGAADAPKAGRRAGRRANPDDASADGKTDAPAPRRRAADGSEIAGGRADAPSGWGEPGPSAPAFPQRVSKPLPEPDDEEDAGAGRRRMKRVADEPNEEVVAIIRDNDEEVAEDLATKVAEAPRNAGALLQCDWCARAGCRSVRVREARMHSLLVGDRCRAEGTDAERARPRRQPHRRCKLESA